MTINHKLEWKLENSSACSERVCWDCLREFLHAHVSRRLPTTVQREIGVSDVVQSVLLRIQLNRERFDGETSAQFRAWSLRIAENRVIDGLRRYRRRREMEKSALVTQAASPSPSDHSPPGVSAQREDARRLLEEVGKLPPVQRQVVMLRTTGGMTFGQIAERMDLPVTSCRREWLRALETLRGAAVADGLK